MTALAMANPCPSLLTAASPTFDRWRHDRIIEARRILAEAPRHRPTLVALASRVLAEVPKKGGAA